MEKSESSIQREIILYLERDGWYVLKLIQTNKNGIPDLMAIRDGITIFIEVKQKGCHPRPLQVHRMNELTTSGVLVFVADSVDAIRVNIPTK
jgi:Holliday junction resolvase